MDKRDSIIGVDVGGTSMGVGLIRNGELVKYTEGATGAHRSAEEVL
jgi:N-methylhydantoinase A/oxoprolinase/acetone carboxylase beta subunit